MPATYVMDAQFNKKISSWPQDHTIVLEDMQIHMQRLMYKISCRLRKYNLGVDLDPSELRCRSDKRRSMDVDIP